MTKLLSQVTIKDIILKNRLVMSPMGTQQSLFNDRVSLDDLYYYHNRAGAPSLVITGAAQVQANGRSLPGMFGAYSDTQINGLQKLANTIKAKGSKAILQIFHSGRMTSQKNTDGRPIVGPSPIKSEREEFDLPRELTESEIEELITDFVKATQRAILAGFDGIELHGAHTYIVQQFFSPNSNHRSDKWGGNIEKRYYFIDVLTNRITQTIEKSENPNFIFGYRISPEEYETQGIRFEDTLYLIKKLVKKPIDYIHVSVNHYLKVSRSPEYSQYPMLKYIKEITNDKTLLMGVGGIRTNEDANTALDFCDLIAVGSPMIADLNFAEKLLKGELKDDNHYRDLPKLNDLNDLFDYVQTIRDKKEKNLIDKA
ncbi:Putative NADH-dependent flavin oxidoreductase [Enterococcus durans IPLA 655]|uniref:oxidoreductase n=1 Tax=Enterococcus durans TaxID=53345 RepID=UPI0003285CCA|nr:NADH-dependent flavin oxidoreductase [Enterococcus durans]EMS74316.1 Putative NADH-dependent flavin oxidoreductase [Enterococcus durans IPLA 655]